MCGRFSLAEYYESLEEYFKIDEHFDDIVLKPRYNIAPSQYSPVVINENGRNILKMFNSKSIKIIHIICIISF